MSNYIHGSAPEEQARLAKLNELINGRCLHLLEIRPGDKILDVGSGLGQFTLLMAERTGASGRCLGIERDINQLNISIQNQEEGHLPWVAFRQGNAETLELAPQEWNSFDVAHARFILEHVRQPKSVIEGMARALRAGGKVFVADDDHEHMCLYPSPEGFSAVWEAYMASYERLGNDPHVGRKLVSLLHESGLRDIRNNVVFFGDSAESPTFQAYVANLIGILEGAQEVMLQHKLIEAHVFQKAIQNLRDWSKKSDAACWYTIHWAEGTKV